VTLTTNARAAARAPFAPGAAFGAAAPGAAPLSARTSTWQTMAPPSTGSASVTRGSPRRPLASRARPWLDDLAAPPCNAMTDCGARGDNASDDTAALPSPNTPAWVNHIAFNVDGIQALEDSKARLQAHGVEVLGITDHRIFKSIYFFDPNGIRLELSAQVAPPEQMHRESLDIRAQLDAWTAQKRERNQHRG
jgi:catechol 2,3-dioxygenase-like lactoylglutathione lyase family enzyme